MKVDKSLQEVWDWKEKVYEDTKTLSTREAANKIKEAAKEICKKYNLHLKKLAPHK